LIPTRAPEGGVFTFEFLGCGTSVGVPCIACACPVCTSRDPLNRRLRPSGLVSLDGFHLVIDTGPDFREQMLRVGQQDLDAVLLTHFHYDHFGGLDDLRRFTHLRQRAMDVYGLADTHQRLRAAFPYMLPETFRPHLPNLAFHEMELGKPYAIGPLRARVFPTDHTVIQNIAVILERLGPSGDPEEPGIGPRLAYCLDCKVIPEETVAALAGVEYLILDMLREQPHSSHLNLAEALGYLERIRPARTWFSHLGHDVDYQAFQPKLPPRVYLAYDSLRFQVQ
jgi:phosphoribosyl 1,2-cyclic phosphate phosphodiesterase